MVNFRCYFGLPPARNPATPAGEGGIGGLPHGFGTRRVVGALQLRQVLAAGLRHERAELGREQFDNARTQVARQLGVLKLLLEEQKKTEEAAEQK